ncbi:MAG: acetate--CoA ligase family protein [bacterium]
MTSSFFSPKSVAVIGASTNPKKLGYMIIDNLKNSGYTGRIYPINSKADENTIIIQYKAYSSVSSIHEIPELVIISIPTDFVFDELMKSYAFGVKNFVIITAGFKEIGNDNAEKLINQFISIHPDANILGPNCLGYIDTQTPINASFAASMPMKGNISFYSQSGALCTAILDWSDKVGMGFSKFVSLGNKNQISENIFLDSNFINSNDNAKPSFFYLESFKDGKEFVNKAKKVKSPLVILHPGRYSETAAAMQSHTGSMASNDRVISEALDEAGIIRAYGLEDIMDLMMIFNFYPSFRKVQRVAIVSNAGGPGIITTDCIKDYKLELSQLNDNTKRILSERLPKTANIHNPIDVVGDAMADRYGYALDTVLADENVDAVIVLLTPQAMTQIDLTAEFIQRLAKQHNKVVVASFMGGKRVDKYEQYLFSYGIPYFDYPERAVWALSKLNLKESNNLNSQVNIPDNVSIENIFKTPSEKDITNEQDLYSFIPEGKIVMKLISDQMWHKSDTGGVKLHLDSNEKRLHAYKELIQLGEDQKKENSNFEYKILMQEMVKIDIELFIGAKRDSNFGNVVAFGMGGIYANIIDENMLFLSFADKDYIKNKILNSKTGQILNGARGQKGIDIDSLADSILSLHKILSEHPEISDIDINPLGVVNGELYAVDIKIK